MEILDMNMAQWLSVLLAFSGVIAMILSSIGILRLPDVYTRLHAASQARTLGIGALLLSVAAYEWSIIVTIKMLLFVALFLFVMPVTAHMLVRAAYIRGVKLTEATRVDDLAGVYQRKRHKQP
jgi:multicomponent Na+:H+ antiporter subunit G